MVEINVTSLINRFQDDNDLDPMDLSGSVMEHGHNAGILTWNNCKDLATENTDLNAEILKHSQDVRDHFTDYGAWSREEINQWTNKELVAIMLQEIAASYRELEANDFIEDGSVSGRLFQCDIQGHENYGQWFFYVGL